MSFEPTMLVASRLDERDEHPLISMALADFLAPVPVTLVGLYQVPDQTAIEQAREQFEAEARGRLDALADPFRATGADIETRLTFTHDPAETIAKIAADIDRLAVLRPGALDAVDRVLIAVRGGINVPAIATVATALLADTSAAITLYHAAPADADERDEDRYGTGEQALDATERALIDAGIAPQRLSRTIERADDPDATLIGTAANYDVLIIGEGQPTIAGRIFGETHERIAEQLTLPVVIVRRPTDKPPDDTNPQ